MGKNIKRLTPELIQAIIERYDGTTDVIDELVEQFNVPRYTVTRYASVNGLAKRIGSNWSQEEIDFLQANVSRGSAYISRKLKKSPSAVRLKLNRLGSSFRDSHLLTANYVSKILNIDVHSVCKWIETGLLKFTTIKGQKTYRIDLKDLEKFLKGNLDLWDSRKIKTSLWINEPEWFKEKKRKDLQRPSREGHKWTKEEDKRAISLFKTGLYTYKQIGTFIGRSSDGVEKRLNRLDIWGTGKYLRN